MELSPENLEKVKKMAPRAAALVVGGAVVKYVYEQGKAKGYVYFFKESGSLFVGLLNSKGIKAQITGLFQQGESYSEFSPSIMDLDDSDVPEFEKMLNIQSEEDNPLQTG